MQSPYPQHSQGHAALSRAIHGYLWLAATFGRFGVETMGSLMLAFFGGCRNVAESMRRTIVALAMLAVLFTFADRTLAWSSAGHMVIAGEAFRDLPPGFKFKTSKILESHPEYQKWVKTFGSGRSDVDLQTYIFMRASAWPDEIRKAESRYEHPHWHYIDYPLRPPSCPMEPAPAPEDDALYGIDQCEKFLKDTNSTPEMQAVYLSYLIHLIGDIHQPLHCGSLFDSAHPNGDKGGNEFYVKPGSKGIRLHAFWDELLGTRINMPAEFHHAIQVDSDYPRSSLPELKKEKTPKDWSLESRTLAIEKVYLNGELKGGMRADAAPALPPGYVATAQTVAEKQAARAGYRLSDEIQKYVR